MKLISLNLIVHIKICRRICIINGNNGKQTTLLCHTNANEMFHDSQYNNQLLKVLIYYISRLDQRLQSFVYVFHNPPLNKLGLLQMENLARGIQFYVSSLGGSVSALSTEPDCIVF